LGEPGSGKTTLLLELARDLLLRAESDPSQPIPVVFPLSTWAQSCKPLPEWLEDELSGAEIRLYGVQRQIAKPWIATNHVLPLLDGLDEVHAKKRSDCLDAINAFRGTFGLVPLVVTSRTSEYEAPELEPRPFDRPLAREVVSGNWANKQPRNHPEDDPKDYRGDPASAHLEGQSAAHHPENHTAGKPNKQAIPRADRVSFPLFEILELKPVYVEYGLPQPDHLSRQPT
jgi:hypothetical protein